MRTSCAQVGEAAIATAALTAKARELLVHSDRGAAPWQRLFSARQEQEAAIGTAVCHMTNSDPCLDDVVVGAVRVNEINALHADGVPSGRFLEMVSILSGEVAERIPTEFRRMEF